MHATTNPGYSALPKAHLHLHLVGAMRRTTLNSLLRRQNMVPPIFPARLSSKEFARHYDLATLVLQRPEDLVRLVDEIVEDQVADGVWWVEITTDPLLYKGRFGSPAEGLDLLLEAGRQAADRHGVGVGWIVCANRASSPAARLVATLAADRADRGVVGFGLAGDESRGASPTPFAGAFAIAHEAGLLLCPHAGERRGPHDLDAALRWLAPDRIGHGLAAAADPNLLAAVADREICIESCPASNVALGLTPSLEAHPLPRFLAAGIPVALGTDDPLLFGGDLTKVYDSVATAFGFGPAEMAALALTSFRHSAAPLSLRRRAETAVRSWLSEARSDRVAPFRLSA